MNYKVSFTTQFTAAAKRLSKRHRSFLDDFTTFKESLQANPYQGVEIAPNIRKIRMAVTSKGRGSSGGIRVITATTVISESEGRIGFLYIYDKADMENVSDAYLREVIKRME